MLFVSSDWVNTSPCVAAGIPWRFLERRYNARVCAERRNVATLNFASQPVQDHREVRLSFPWRHAGIAHPIRAQCALGRRHHHQLQHP